MLRRPPPPAGAWLGPGWGQVGARLWPGWGQVGARLGPGWGLVRDLDLEDVLLVFDAPGLRGVGRVGHAN